MVDILTEMPQKFSCLIAYTFLVYGALLTIFGFFSIEFAVETAPVAFGLLLLHWSLQRFLLQASQEELVTNMATDFGLIVIGLIPGITLRKRGVFISLISFVVAGCLILGWIHPSIVSRCGG